jgi:hypothetical protein
MDPEARQVIKDDGTHIICTLNAAIIMKIKTYASEKRQFQTKHLSL